jgi:hypothetical protein
MQQSHGCEGAAPLPWQRARGEGFLEPIATNSDGQEPECREAHGHARAADGQRARMQRPHGCKELPFPCVSAKVRDGGALGLSPIRAKLAPV